MLMVDGDDAQELNEIFISKIMRLIGVWRCI